ncbi:MAG: hypothetical protein VW802_04420 [Rhodospirillaceae bacterium]|jgi:hypothetical protein
MKKTYLIPLIAAFVLTMGWTGLTTAPAQAAGKMTYKEWRQKSPEMYKRCRAIKIPNQQKRCLNQLDKRGVAMRRGYCKTLKDNAKKKDCFVRLKDHQKRLKRKKKALNNLDKRSAAANKKYIKHLKAQRASLAKRCKAKKGTPDYTVCRAALYKKDMEIGQRRCEAMNHPGKQKNCLTRLKKRQASIDKKNEVMKKKLAEAKKRCKPITDKAKKKACFVKYMK